MDLEEIKRNLVGPAIAMTIPMKPNYDVDEEGLSILTRFMIDHGIVKGKGVLMASTTIGEAPFMTMEERMQVMDVAAKEAGDKAILATSVQDTSERDAINLAKHAQKVGYHCVQVSPPFYYNTSPDEVYRFVKAIADSIDIGIMVYNTTWLRILSGVGFDANLMGRLADIENVIAVKWSSPDWLWYIGIMRTFKDRFNFIDNNYHGLGAMFGAKGWLAGSGCFDPGYALKVWDHLKNHQYDEAIALLWKLHIPLYQFSKKLDSQGLHGSVVLKTATGMAGLPAGPCRPPYNHSLTEEQKRELRQILINGDVKVK